MEDRHQRLFTNKVSEHKFFTRVNDSTWLVKLEHDSIMCSYYVTLLPVGGIAMYGDYNGVLVFPHGVNNERQMLNWMRNATTYEYFTEKVRSTNRYHKVEIFDEECGVVDNKHLMFQHALLVWWAFQVRERVVFNDEGTEWTLPDSFEVNE